MVKDEADIVGSTVRRMRDQVDHVLVADNGSTDGTREILEGLDVEVIDDPEVGYLQSQKMSRLAELARSRGADWIVPFDADEVHLCKGGLGPELAALSSEVLLSEAPLVDHVATADDDQTQADPVRRMRWRRAERVPLRKVACRAVDGLVIHQGNHGADHGERVDGLLVVRHFPYRSVEQFVSKVRNGAAAYAATDLPEHQGQHWRDYGRLLESGGPDALADVFRAWFWQPYPTRDLIRDPAPST